METGTNAKSVSAVGLSAEQTQRKQKSMIQMDLQQLIKNSKQGVTERRNLMQPKAAMSLDKHAFSSAQPSRK